MHTQYIQKLKQVPDKYVSTERGAQQSAREHLTLQPDGEAWRIRGPTEGSGSSRLAEVPTSVSF